MLLYLIGYKKTTFSSQLITRGPLRV